MLKFLKHLDQMDFNKQILEVQIEELTSDEERHSYILNVIGDGIPLSLSLSLSFSLSLSLSLSLSPYTQHSTTMNLGKKGFAKCRSFFNGELQSTIKALQPKKKEMEELEKSLKEEEERKRKWIEGIKFHATIDLATGKADHKTSVVPPAPGKDGSVKSPKKGKGSKRAKGSRHE